MRQIIPASFCTVKSHHLLSLIERTKLKYSFSLVDQSTTEKMKTPTELFFSKGICISILYCYPISPRNLIFNAKMCSEYFTSLLHILFIHLLFVHICIQTVCSSICYTTSGFAFKSITINLKL